MVAECRAVILNVNCFKKDKLQVATVEDGKLILKEYDSSNTNLYQDWVITSNIVTVPPLGAVTGGFSLYNVGASDDAGKKLAAKQPDPGGQVALDEPGNEDEDWREYCWTFWPAGTSSSGLQYWSIQSDNRGNGWDGDNFGCSDGTEVLFWHWKNGDNQRWIISIYEDGDSKATMLDKLKRLQANQ